MVVGFIYASMVTSVGRLHKSLKHGLQNSNLSACILIYFDCDARIIQRDVIIIGRAKRFTYVFHNFILMYYTAKFSLSFSWLLEAILVSVKSLHVTCIFLIFFFLRF